MKTISSEKTFLSKYDPNKFERPSTSVDCVIYTIISQELHVLLVKRAEFPFRENWSLVGGYIDLTKDHDIETTAKRKLYEKTGVKTPYLEQVFTVGNKYRDPRGWSVTTLYFALINSENVKLQKSKNITDVKWVKLTNGCVDFKLAFDHNELLENCSKRLKNKVLYTSLPLYLMPNKFTLTELQRVYEVVIGQKIDVKSFRRRILTTNLIEETDEEDYTTKRPAKIYRKRKGITTHYFMRNIEGVEQAF